MRHLGHIKAWISVRSDNKATQDKIFELVNALDFCFRIPVVVLRGEQEQWTGYCFDFCVRSQLIWLIKRTHYIQNLMFSLWSDLGRQLADNQFCTWSLTHLHHSGHAYMVTWPRSRESWEWVFKTYTEYSFNIIKDLIMTCIYWKHGWTQINTRISIIVNTQIKSQISDGGDIYFYSEASE